jgi:hypothetical protein
VDEYLDDGMDCFYLPYVQQGPVVDVTVGDFELSGAQSIKDGGTALFSVNVTSGTLKTIQWSFKAPTDAGNNPNVNFTSPNSTKTFTDGHWFAIPNVACPAQSDLPAYYNAQYEIKATVTFGSDQNRSKTTTLTVNAFWSPAGFVDPNVADVTGGPTIGVNSSGIWVVVNKGTLARRVPTTMTIFVPTTSQFYNKTVSHEQVHLNQWIAGPGHLYGDLFSADDFFNQIKGLTGTSKEDLFNKLVQAKTTYINAQVALVQQRRVQSEREAHAVSDPISPQYVYQNCGQW